MTAIGCNNNLYRLIYQNSYGYKISKDAIRLVDYSDQILTYSETTIGKDGRDVEEFFTLDLKKYKVLELSVITPEIVAA